MLKINVKMFALYSFLMYVCPVIAIKQHIKTIKMKKRIQLTTVALADNQHLKPIFHSSIVETYCEGYTEGRRDRKLDGHYFTKELTVKPTKIKDMKEDETHFIS